MSRLATGPTVNSGYIPPSPPLLPGLPAEILRSIGGVSA